MEKNDICEQVLKVLKETIGDDERVLDTYDDDINDVLNSVEFICMVVELESIYNIELNDKDFEIGNMNTIRKFADLISNYIK